MMVRKVKSHQHCGFLRTMCNRFARLFWSKLDYMRARTKCIASNSALLAIGKLFTLTLYAKTMQGKKTDDNSNVCEPRTLY